jgi:hypothetical protein
MGTSKGKEQGSGGVWTPLKRAVTAMASSPSNAAVDRVISRSAGAVFQARAGGGGAGTVRSGAAAQVAARLASFVTSVRSEGLSEAAAQLGVSELNGPPAEVIAQVSAHLCTGLNGTDRDLAFHALRTTLLEICDLEGDQSYENLESSLEAFLARDGIEGLLEVYFSNIAMTELLYNVETHIDKQSPTVEDATLLKEAISARVRALVGVVVKEKGASAELDTVDWFGREGQRMAADLVRDLVERLRSLEDTE